MLYLFLVISKWTLGAHSGHFQIYPYSTAPVFAGRQQKSWRLEAHMGCFRSSKEQEAEIGIEVKSYNSPFKAGPSLLMLLTQGQEFISCCLCLNIQFYTLPGPTYGWLPLRRDFRDIAGKAKVDTADKAILITWKNIVRQTTYLGGGTWCLALPPVILSQWGVAVQCLHSKPESWG